MPVIAVGLIVETVSADPPNETVAPLWKPVPFTVTDVPPAIAPVAGVTELTAGAGAMYVKQPVHVAFSASAFVTTTFTAPAVCAVVVPLMLVPAIVNAVRAEPPNDTVAPAENPVPVTVTEVPPAAGPVFGVTDVTVGAATYVKQPVHEALCASGFVTVTFTGPAA